MKLTPLFIITILLASVFTSIPITNAVPAEQIINGGFETAGATFWNYDNWGVDSRVNTDSHSGSWSFNGYSVHNNQTFGVPLQVSGISELSYWHIGDQVPIIKIIYSDTSEEDITDAKSVGVWAQENITADLDAGKSIERIELWCGNNNPIWYDDIILLWESPIPVPVSVDITDMDTVNNIYSMRKYYTFEAVATSLTDPCDIANITITAKQGGAVLFTVLGFTLDLVPQWSITSGSTEIDLDSANCLWSVVGNTGTATFKIRTEWDFPDDSNLDLYLTAENGSGASAETLMQTDYFDVISTLVATMNTGTPNVPLNFPVGITGLVTYPTAVGGLVSSGFYPPNAQFTGVALYEDATLIVTDNGVVNGAYDVSFTPEIKLMSHTYHLHLDLLPDFVDGHPANNPTLIIKVSNKLPDIWLGIAVGMDAIFSLFGVVPVLVGGVMTSPTEIVVDWITAMSSYFIDSVILMINTTTMLGSMIIGGGGFLLDWGGKVVTVVITTTGIVKGIFDGTGYTVNGILYVFPNGIGNVWTTLGGANTVALIPILIIVWWLRSVDSRIISTGQNMFSICIGDIQTAFGLISIFTWFAMLVYSSIFSIVQWVFGLIGGVLV